jgi:DNA-binding MarR family transcriptional regulator
MTAATRDLQIQRMIDATDRFMHRISEWHAAEFLEIDISMPQAKVLYLAASGEGGLRMSALATRLGVTLSTVSGLVDRLVDAGLAARRDDLVDRRQVIVSVTSRGSDLMERFRELNRRQAQELFGGLADDDLDTVERAFELLAGAAGHVHLRPGSGATTASQSTVDVSDAASTGEGNPS